MYDVAIIGAGAAGIACAKEAARYKLKTILLERALQNFGGTCINTGCIPTKFFLNSSKINKDWGSVSKQSENLIEKIKQPALNYLKKIGVEIMFGQVSFLSEHTLKIDTKAIEARNIIIACGSKPKKITLKREYTFAQELFRCQDIAQNILIIGAGYIGIEFASLLNNFSKNVTVVEKEENILPVFSTSLTSRLRLILERKNIRINTAVDIDKYNIDNFEKIILSVGRQPDAETLSLRNAGIICSKQGWIKTDRYLRTNIKNIYACGDIAGKKLLAYIAEYQAKICCANITGKKETQDYTNIPECVFSLPQAACIGITEEEAKLKNIKHKIIRSNFLKFSSAYVYGDTDGFMQLIVSQGDRIIGASIISNFAAELIAIFSLAIRAKIKIVDLKKNIFIHPTLSEIIPAVLRES